MGLSDRELPDTAQTTSCLRITAAAPLKYLG
jgi:hypothetical protein